MGSIGGRARVISWVCGGIILTAGFAACAPANTIVVKQNGVVSDSNYETVNLTIANDGTGHSLTLNGAIADEQKWQYVSGTPVSPSPDFDTFCIEILQDVAIGSSYTFDIVPNLANAPTPGTGVTTMGTGTGMGSVRAALIEAMWAHFVPTLVTDADRAAFQSAIWEVVYETATSGPNLVLDLSSGNFSLSGSNPSGIVGEAQGMLNWAAAADLSVAPRANLVALSSPTDQDQITMVPLPQASLAGMALLGAVCFSQIRRRNLT